ncbi:hypothetical protein PRZ48_009491 [Zasmidium cellare]|uniref:F-box domain-containing protein n=1 Tax=Zasmidium cellare TaxID=395010 RepID=A0ABR0EBV5_ZASCE|nr:hypothetical protein PRZ48_009491 [Zasmidium cellare]
MPGHAQRQRARAAENARWKREEANRKTFAFLKLPTEIKNKIYDMILPHDRIIDVFYEFADRHRRVGSDGMVLTELLKVDASWTTWIGITQATRLIRQEANRYYYGSNIFVIGISNLLWDRSVKWLRTRPQDAFCVMPKLLLCEHTVCLSSSHIEHTRVVQLDLFTLETRMLKVWLERDPFPRNEFCPPCFDVCKKGLVAMRKRILFKRQLANWLDGEPTGERAVQAIRTLRCDTKSFTDPNLHRIEAADDEASEGVKEV